MIYTQIRYWTYSEHGNPDRRTETVFGSARNLLLKMIDSPGSVAKPLVRLKGSLVLGNAISTARSSHPQPLSYFAIQLVERNEA